MSDHMIPVEKVQELIDAYWEYEKDCMNGALAGETPEVREVSRGRAGLYRTVIADLERLLPAPTLADIPPEEHCDCVWREARNLLGEHFMIVRIWEDSCRILWADGSVTVEQSSDVIPLMDKPRGVIPWADV